MNRVVTLLAALALPFTALADAYAPTPKLPSGYDNQMTKGILEQVKKDCPDKAKVEAPAYPGAVAISMRKGQNGALSTITLMSKADTKTIAEWYKGKLEGWHSKEAFDSIFFWKGSKDDFAMMGSKVPQVSIVEAMEEAIDRKVHPEGKTHITVYYGAAKK